MNTSLKNIAG